MIFEGHPINTAAPGGVVTACIENGADRLLLDSSALPPEFYDLSTGVLGVIVQRAMQYDILLAAVVTDLETRSDSFQKFVREANLGGRLHFAGSRNEATLWLQDVGS